MKQGLSLRVSQHLALTPQLQQSIRLLQLSTLELSQEVEQMLDDNPFLELNQDEAPREEFGLAQADAPPPQDEREAEFADYAPPAGDDMRAAADGTRGRRRPTLEAPNWEGDGSTEVVPDDGEWGGDAPRPQEQPRRRRRGRRHRAGARPGVAAGAPAPPGAGPAPVRGGPLRAAGS